MRIGSRIRSNNNSNSSRDVRGNGRGGLTGGSGGEGSGRIRISMEGAAQSHQVTTTITKPPAWLQRLMEETTFFDPCGDHEDRKKNEKNIFCLNCCRSFCPHCLSYHSNYHPFLQVRRYVYNEVVRLDDLQKLIDCAHIQPYTINGAKVMFLNARPQQRSYKDPANYCLTCARILQHPYHYCCLSCKVDHLVYKGEDLSVILKDFDASDLPITQFEGFRIESMDMEDNNNNNATGSRSLSRSSSMLDVSMPCQVSSCSSDAMDHSGITSGNNNPVDMVMKSGSNKKGSSRGLLGGIDVFSFNNNRRKGAHPQRSPLS